MTEAALLGARPTATGHGIDHDAALIDRAKHNADGRDLASRVRFLADREQFVMAQISRAEADRAREAADEHRNGYFPRRGILGFAFLTLGRPAEGS